MRRWITAALVSATALLSSGGFVAGAAAATAGTAPTAGTPAPGGVQLPGLVSDTPVKWTPNVFAGSPSCDPQWFGSGGACDHSTVYSMAVVNGEVVVAGAFTQACQPGPASSGHCTPGTLVTRDDIFAYQLSSGTIDPNFTPVLDQGPVFSVVAGPGDTVYAGGAFTTVNGTSHAGVVQLSVTPGQGTDGQVVPAFGAQIGGTVDDLALNGSALYAGGAFKTADGVKAHAITRLNAQTGAVDPAFSITPGSPVSGTGLAVEKVALTPDGKTLAIAGTFQVVNGRPIGRVALINTGGGLGSTAVLDNWAAPVLASNCSRQQDYVRGIDFSQDGSYFVIATTGYMPGASGLSVCDSAARFETRATGTDVQPAWINYFGGDSAYAVAVTGNIVYIGGHNRWVNNECGNNSVCEANAVLVNGITALDPSTGLALPWWHPQTLRGVGVESLVPFPAGAFDGSNGGLLLGTDVNSIGGAYHSENAMFPLGSTASHPVGGPIRSGMFSLGRINGHDESPSGTAAMCVDDAGGSSAPGTAVQLATCQNGPSQNWTIAADGTIRINGGCLDTQGAGTAPGTLTVLNTCGGSPTQVWAQEAGNTLVNQASGLCLDDPGGNVSGTPQLDIASCDGSAGQIWPLPVAQAPPKGAPTGAVYPAEIQKDTQVPCLDDANDKAVAGNKVVLEACEGTAPEKWTMEPDGTFRIVGMCLDATGNFQTAQVVLNTCNGSTSQDWQPGGNHSLVSQASGLCLDDPGFNTRDGTQLQIYGCNGGQNQQWWLPAS
jgi:hypothetical protein